MLKAPFKPRLKLLHKGLLLVLAPLAIEFMFILTLWHLLDTADHDARRLAHARRVMAETAQLQHILVDQGRALLFYSFSPTDENKQRYLTSATLVNAQIDELELLCSEDASERQCFDRIRSALQEMELAGERPLRVRDQVMRRLDITLPHMTKLLADATPQYKAAAVELLKVEMSAQGRDEQAENNGRRKLRTWIASFAAAHILIAACIAVYFYRNLLSRLNILLQNAARLAAGRPLLPRLRGDDEIDLFDAAFHKMADDLAAAAEYKRQMIAVVSHELRTPLTATRGSLTLLTAGVLGALSQAQQAIAQRLEQISSNLIQQINDLLDKEKAEHEHAE